VANSCALSAGWPPRCRKLGDPEQPNDLFRRVLGRIAELRDPCTRRSDMRVDLGERVADM